MFGIAMPPGYVHLVRKRVSSCSNHQISRRNVLQGVSAAAVTGLVACAPGEPTEAKKTSSGADASGSPAASQSSASQAPAAPSTEWTTAAPALIPGITEVTLSADAKGKQVVTPRFPKARNLTQATEVVRGRLLRQAAWDEAKKVEIRGALLAASQDAIGLAVLANLDADNPTVPSVIWYDTRKQQSFASPELISASKWGDFAQAVHQAAADAGLDQEKVDTALIDRSAPYGNGPAMAFNTDGHLVLAFRAGAVSDAVERIAVDATAWLSDFGRIAKSASLTPSEFTGKPSISITHFAPVEDRSPVTASPNRPSDGSDAADSLPKPTPGGKVRPSTAIGYDAVAERCVALTYDDGPGEKTPEMLATFNAAQATATFFQLGNSIQQYPGTTLDVAASGHEVGSHSVTHPDLARQSKERVEKEVGKNSEYLKEAIGFDPLLFRPPYGSHNKTVDEIVASHGMAIVQWSVDTEDWKTRNTASTVGTAVKDGKEFTEPIILMHDIHDSTVAAAEEIIHELTDAGIQLVTVSELTLNTGGIFTGHAYCRGTGIKQQGYACKG